MELAVSGIGTRHSEFFSDIYTRAKPHKSTELIQYSHIIHTTVWENVYSYDKDFRLHMAENPGRSWAIILQQAWSLHLRDRRQHEDYHRENNYDKQVFQVEEKKSARDLIGGPVQVASVVDTNIDVHTVSSLVMVFTIVDTISG